MARINFITEKTPSIKKGPIPSKKWKKRFYISLVINVLLALTTIYVVFY